MFTAQLICQGACRQVDIVRAFGVSKGCDRASAKDFHEIRAVFTRGVA